jgi:hypothetical protein
MSMMMVHDILKQAAAQQSDNGANHRVQHETALDGVAWSAQIPAVSV